MNANPLESSLILTLHSEKKHLRDNSSLELEPDHKKRKIKLLAKASIDSSNQNFYQSNRLPSIKKITFPDGSFYEGQLVNGVKHGVGKHTFPDGSFYDGQWANNVYHGKGTYVFSDGSSYEGDWAQNAKHGRGTYIFSDGSSYEGDWAQNAKHGKGTYIYSDGSSYEGDWAQDAKHGKGIFTHVDGFSYDGDWVQDTRHGKGTLIDLNGASYVGDWAQDTRHGKGIYTFPDGASYEGDWAQDAKHGKGIHIFPDRASYYEGDWANNIKHGRGIYTYPDKSTHEGEWANDVKHGKGTSSYPNGILCEGEWVNDQIITNIQNLSDDLFFDLLCGLRQNMPPNGYCLGIIEDYLRKKDLVEIADPLKEALRCSFLNAEEAEKESDIIYDELNKKNRSRLICYGYKDHEMGLKLVPGVFPGFILCKIFNTGIGLETFHEIHPSDTNKAKLQLDVKVPVENLTPNIIKTLLLSVWKSEHIDEAYGHILNLPGREILPSDSFPWKNCQKGNDCTLQWIQKVYLEDEMPQERAKQIRQQLKQDCREARIAKQGV